MIGFIKRILGSKKVGKTKGKPAEGIELSVRIIEVQVSSMKQILVGMSGDIGKMVKGMDSLSRYFEYELERAKKMEEFESLPPGKDDDRY